jgi:dephospho-CoA kinase
MSPVLRIALTGGIGSGKSTVTTKFEQLGVPVIDSDLIARDIVSPEKPYLNTIIQEFGNGLLTDSGTLDREKLRSIIFNDDSKKTNLENILHPAIYQEIEKQIAEVDYPYCLIEIPLLIETNAMDRFDRILVVDTPESIQIQRAQNRDNTSIENIEKIIKNQIRREERLKYADDVIENNHTIERLNETISNLHRKYLNLSSYNFKKNE